MNNIGPNVKRLIAMKIAREAIPPGGGFSSGLEFLLDKERVKKTFEESKLWVKEKINEIKSSPNNPYGNDDESIAEAIIKKIDERNEHLN